MMRELIPREVLEENLVATSSYVRLVVVGEPSSAMASMLSALHRHPAGPVSLLQLPPTREGLGPVEKPDVVEPEESAGKNVPTVYVFPVDPPREVHKQFCGKHAAAELGNPLRRSPWRLFCRLATPPSVTGGFTSSKPHS